MVADKSEGGGWERDLPGKLQVFVDIWRAYEGTELSGAQQFLHSLLEIYEANFKPGEIFEQHPVRVAAQGTTSPQGSLFPGETVKYTTRRMDLYLPKICVWEMKGPGERDLSKHHDQLLGYWSRMRTRYMVLCNFHEFWIYDTEEPDGQLSPKLRFALHDPSLTVIGTCTGFPVVFGGRDWGPRVLGRTPCFPAERRCDLLA